MPNQPIRFSISREAALRAKVKTWGESFYEPDDAELAELSADERAVLSVFEGGQPNGKRLDIFTMPPWTGIVARLRGATGIEEADRALGEHEIREWLKGPRPVLKLSGVPTETAVQIANGFNFMSLDTRVVERAVIANSFVRRLTRLVSQTDLQLAHELPEPLVVDRVVFDREFSFQPRPEPRLFQTAVRDRVAARCAELLAWLPASTVLEVGPVSRLTTNDSKWTGVCVLVAHPGSPVRNVVVFSAEADD